MQSVLRMVILKVMYENSDRRVREPGADDAAVQAGRAGEPEVNDRPTISCCTAFTALLGGPEMEVPAGYTQIVYEPRYVLAADKKNYLAVTGDVESRLPYPMPLSLMFWAGPGSDPAVIRVASAYEAATHHRVPPFAFGTVPREPPRQTKPTK